MGKENARLIVLSDTHGHLPDEVVKACEGVDGIVHAGDVGSERILPMLEALAPVFAVSGNVDPPDAAPVRARFEAGSWLFMVQHIVWNRGAPSGEVQEALARDFADVVVFGHSHEPLCRRIGGAVFFNPGSCGAKRFSLPRTYGEVVLNSRGGWFQIFDLDQPAGSPPIVERRFGGPGSDDVRP